MYESESPRWSIGLQGSARRIAEISKSPLRVVAGPGTGKTFALMRRVMRLLEEGVQPSCIMVCTFTRTAARDLQDELTELRVPRAEEVYADNIHSFCFSLL
jgi:DNA helicase-2/ATP-dependent DNA helicase PcrA